MKCADRGVPRQNFVFAVDHTPVAPGEVGFELETVGQQRVFECKKHFGQSDEGMSQSTCWSLA